MPGHDEKEDRLMFDEWEDWKAWCAEFKEKVGKEVNEKQFEKLVGLVEKWGYSMMALRNYQATHGKPELLAYEKGALFKSYLERKGGKSGG